MLTLVTKQTGASVNGLSEQNYDVYKNAGYIANWIDWMQVLRGTISEIKLGCSAIDIQELQIWSTVFTAETVNAYYQSPPIGSEKYNDQSVLLVFYDFTEGSGTTLHNKGSLGSQCDAVIQNGTWTAV
jgi:hypothetical protein